jgi:cellulose synthase/poly-beta-1,6-N-acetylglucosamine synthase-like glycosyltransferase
MTLSWFGKLASIFFFTATCLGVLRLLFICGMGLRNRHKEPVRVPSALPNDPPLQTVLIPAHNEAKVVVQTVTHILASDYANIEVIYDGSVHGTPDVVRRFSQYVTSQNLERRALATLGCITVVPGAIGAWRREALLKLGGFPSDTLAEDQDLTLALLKRGYKVLYDSTAIAWTEAPVSGLIKQRFRWAFGTLQCLWKPRDVTLRPRYRLARADRRAADLAVPIPVLDDRTLGRLRVLVGPAGVGAGPNRAP